jgi:hypothetical protein
MLAPDGLILRAVTMGISAELDDLRRQWDTAYVITYAGMFIARRRDGKGTVTAATADGLCQAIKDDYDASPVSRDVS